MGLRVTQSRIRRAATWIGLAITVVGNAAIAAWALATDQTDVLGLVGALLTFSLAANLCVQIPFTLFHYVRGERGERRLHAQRFDYVLKGDPDADIKRAYATRRWCDGLCQCGGRGRSWSAAAVPVSIAGHWQDTMPLEGAPRHTVHINRCRRLVKGLFEIRGIGRRGPDGTLLCGYANTNSATGETRLAWSTACVVGDGVVASYRTIGVSLEHRATLDDMHFPPTITGVSFVVDGRDRSPDVFDRPDVPTGCWFVLHAVNVEP